MRAEVMAVVALLSTSGCADVLVIQYVGAERLLTITTATAVADGRWRQAGFRVAEADTSDEARLWYGTTAGDGSLPAIVTLPRDEGSAIRSSAVLGDSWVLAGHVTANGKRVAWVRALDEANDERWTTTLPSPDGLSTEATALAATNEGTLIVAGLEQVSASVQEGWVALLDAQGQVRWRHGFRSGFQMQARGFVPLSVMTQDGPPSASRRQVWLAGRRLIPGGDSRGYALQLTLDGELWDSEPFGVTGSDSRGVVAAGNVGLVLCTSRDGAVELGWTSGGAVSGAATTEVRADAFALSGCVGTPSRVSVFGETQRDGAPVPTVITVDRPSRAVVEVQEWTTARGASVFGGAVDGDGALQLLGRTQRPLRRWSARAP
ncbi:MAG: hypothetical protein JNJ54_32740 [Myxococcaceae bacterium]|nr:hypothetical protein [Myxococcaceae bacterium]